MLKKIFKKVQTSDPSNAAITGTGKQGDNMKKEHLRKNSETPIQARNT